MSQKLVRGVHLADYSLFHDPDPWRDNIDLLRRINCKPEWSLMQGCMTVLRSGVQLVLWGDQSGRSALHRLQRNSIPCCVFSPENKRYWKQSLPMSSESLHLRSACRVLKIMQILRMKEARSRMSPSLSSPDISGAFDRGLLRLGR